jgi:hypothetical protein
VKGNQEGPKMHGFENDDDSDKKLVLEQKNVKLSFDSALYQIQLPKNGHPKLEENK